MTSIRVLILVIAALVMGCGGSSWTVVKRPTPRSIVAARTFSVKPLDFSGVSIDGQPEADWRAAGGAAKAKWWDEDKSLANASFMRAITSGRKSGRTFTEAGAPADSPVVVLRVGNVHDADFQLTLQVTTPAGEIIEEATTTLKSRGYGLSDQLRSGGKKMAEAVTEYLAKD